MRYAIKTGAIQNIGSDCLVTLIWNKGKLSDEAAELEEASDGALSALLDTGDFSGKLCETQLLYAPAGISAKRILLVGAGERRAFGARQAVRFLTAASKALAKLKITSAHFALGSIEVKSRDEEWLLSKIAQQSTEACYRYDETKSKKQKAPSLKQVTVSTASGSRRKSLREALDLGAAVGLGVNRARLLGDLPGNICTPTYLAKQATDLGDRYKSMTTRVLSEKQMQRLGMGSLLSVSAGSDEEAKLIIMEHKGGASKAAPHVLVGKGITFDTGGISLKPGLGMDEMKFDMCGAASVVGTMLTISELQLPVNVIGIVAAAENMPSGGATKPGDIVTSMSGKTIEILNTDAEGRLVLCDALSYAERFSPASLIDIATLTGAAVGTFGNVVSALLANDDDLAEELLEAGEAVADPAWQLPLFDEYQKQLNSNFADMANIGGPRAGTITAACFLSRFVEKQKWAHLDIAGSAWNQGPAKGATGRPVPLLVEYLRRQAN